MSTAANYPLSIPEIWGGIECTINRVGDDFRDQLAYNGHYIRNDDIRYFAQTGIRKLRYPILWEKHPEDVNGNIDWSWADKQLNAIKSNNMEPVVGLLHHGSGPSHTDLLDEHFASKLSRYAGRVAKQYPWVEYYTPVNEPLTTARFSGLYGFWYPHQKEAKAFLMMLLNQVKGIILSMEAIRKINPSAKLIQTEDLSKTHNTSLLTYQAVFENQRRWLTFDLLCGKFTSTHPLWNYFLSQGIESTILEFFTFNSCPPDIIGHNYYVSSERYLDENLEHYPENTHGGNGDYQYADIAAVHVHHMDGLENLLKESWDRYGLPMAITECHLNCTREEQMRWFYSAWKICCALSERIPIVALTAWSLTGSTDWDTLLLEKNNRYECGVFDASQGKLRPTIMTTMMTAYANGKEFEHPLLKEKGWWERTQSLTRTSASLLIAGNDAHACAPFVQACYIRGIKTTQSFATTSLWTETHLLSAYKDRKCWGIVLIADDAVLYNLIAHTCLETAIPLLIVKKKLRYQKNIHSSHCMEVLFNENPEATFVNQALDLFIDGEKGCWEASGSGSSKIKMNSVQPNGISMIY